MITCPQCGNQNVVGAAFCDECGASLAGVAPAVAPSAPAPAPAPPAGGVICPVCGASNPPGAAFCDECGASLVAAPPPVTPSVTPAVQPPPVTPPPAAIQPRLVIQTSGAELRIPVGPSEVIVGREDPVSGVFPDINLESHGGDEGGVSRRHAKITIQGNQCFIEDLNSTNYTFVNKQKLNPGVRQLLNEGDEVRFGKVVTIFHAS